jgi:molybdopterin molybdotransferase
MRQTADGAVVDKFPRDGSGLISGLRAANGLIDVREDVAGVEVGQTVDFIPFSEFGILD